MRKIALLATLGLVTISLASSASAAPLTGLATDSQGNVINHAHVTVHWDPSGSQTGIEGDTGLKNDIVLETDDKGAFTTDLPPGFYDVFVAAAGFSPECRKIRIKAGNSASYRAVLKVDPLILDELGDAFNSDGDKPSPATTENSGKQ